jgi:regulator of RNase E activity RraB
LTQAKATQLHIVVRKPSHHNCATWQFCCTTLECYILSSWWIHQWLLEGIPLVEKRPTTKTSEWRTYPSDEHAFTMRDDEPEDESERYVGSDVISLFCML